MTFEEVAKLKRTFDNTPPIVPDNHLYPLVGQLPNKNLVDLCADGPERQTISQINLVYRSLKDGTTIAGTEEILKHCLGQLEHMVRYDWSSPNVFVSIQIFISIIGPTVCMYS